MEPAYLCWRKFRRAFAQLLIWSYWWIAIYPSRQRRELFLGSLFTLLGGVARAEGVITSVETVIIDDFARSLLAPSKAMERDALTWVRRSRSTDISFDVLAGVVGNSLRGSQLMLEIVLDGMVAVALADEVIAPKEDLVLRRVAALWKIPGSVYLSIVERRESELNVTQEEERAKYEEMVAHAQAQAGAVIPEEVKIACALLMVAVQSSDSDLKRAYRKLAMRHHPDRHSPGSRAQNQAAELFREIQQAYDLVVAYRSTAQGA
jgi:DnaJ-domain-containing protein 1